MAVERRDAPCAEPRLQLPERGAPGIGKDEVEPAEPLLREIVGAAPFTERRERHRGVEIVEAAHGGAAFEQNARCLAAVRAVRRQQRGIAVGELAARYRTGLVPSAIEMERAAARQHDEVAMRRVVGHVPLEEHDAVSAPGEGVDEAAPERRVPVPP